MHIPCLTVHDHCAMNELNKADSFCLLDCGRDAPTIAHSPILRWKKWETPLSVGNRLKVSNTHILMFGL